MLPAESNSQVIDSSFYGWTVYEILESEIHDRQCYIVSHPVKSDSNHLTRKNPYIMIARFHKDRSEEVSIFGGFEFKLGSEVFVSVDDKQLRFFAKEDFAWVRTKFEDANAIETILNGQTIKVRGDSAIGTYAVDEYSLKGVTRAYARMREICR